MPARYRALILVTTFASLRWGEVSALRRSDFDLAAGLVVVRAAFVERSDGSLELGPPKSRAGLRAVVLPAFVSRALAAHLDEYTAEDPTALVFTGPTERPLRRSNFNKSTAWHSTVAAIGAPGLHFHDLRHTGNTLAAGTPGTSTRDLMERMGHDSMRAALIYQHATRDADRRIAESLDRHFGTFESGEVARSLHGPNVIDLQDRRPDAATPEESSLHLGAGDGNRTRTVSLGS
ncbi:MAG: tyrosine-type recombinase/integrase [Actinomycetota bacterium]|nr:tyrosine-type recombinase/integrase [Actinomycetota bacterium]